MFPNRFQCVTILCGILVAQNFGSSAGAQSVSPQAVSTGITQSSDFLSGKLLSISKTEVRVDCVAEDFKHKTIVFRIVKSTKMTGVSEGKLVRVYYEKRSEKYTALTIVLDVPAAKEEGRRRTAGQAHPINVGGTAKLNDAPALPQPNGKGSGAAPGAALEASVLPPDDHSGSRIARPFADDKPHVFITNSELIVHDVRGSFCTLGAGDALLLKAAPAEGSSDATVTVLASQEGKDCVQSSSVTVALNDLEEMLNAPMTTIAAKPSGSNASSSRIDAEPAQSEGSSDSSAARDVRIPPTNVGNDARESLAESIGDGYEYSFPVDLHPAEAEARLKEQFPPTYVSSSKSSILVPGTILGLVQNGLEMASTDAKIAFPNSYRYGRITPNKYEFELMSRLSGNPYAEDESSRRTFMAGERVWLTGIHVSKSKVSLDLLSDPYDGVRYYGQLSYPLESGSDKSLRHILRLISETFRSDRSQVLLR